MTVDCRLTMRTVAIAFALMLVVTTGCRSTTAETSTVTILHFSDYHSHAVPFYVDGERDAAGIARAIAWIEPLASRDDVLVFNGGDTMNLGAPAWSDKYGCVEWSWWNGIVDAMAFGNHDADYGQRAFEDCRATIDYPILGANIVDDDGAPLFTSDGKGYAVFERNGIRIGAFALAGSDFRAPIRDTTSPAETVRFLDREQTAREIVDELRTVEGVGTIVLIGHASTEDDIRLAQAVPGIDLILGTHSHRTQPLETIQETSTAMISPGQYLTNVSRVELTFRDGQLADVSGGLVPMTAELAEDPATAALVARLQSELQRDPEYAPLFRELAELDRALSNVGVNEGPTPLGAFVMNAVRLAAGANVALSTSSSFRGSLPPGTIRETDLSDVLPYDNQIVRVTMSGEELTRMFEHVASFRGTDSFAQISGATLELDQHGRLSAVTVAGRALDREARYIVATTDYLASVAPHYRSIFDVLELEQTDLSVREVVRQALNH